MTTPDDGYVPLDERGLLTPGDLRELDDSDVELFETLRELDPDASQTSHVVEVHESDDVDDAATATIVPTTQEGQEPEDHVTRAAFCGKVTADGTPCQRPVVNARDCGIPHDGNTVIRNTWMSSRPIRPEQADWLADEAFHQGGKHDQDKHGRGGGFLAPEKEWKAAQQLAESKIAAAPVPSAAQVTKARAELQKANEGKIRAGGYAGGNSTDRKKQRLNLFNEFGGAKKGYVPCHGCGTKMHHSKDNPDGFTQLERGKIFVKQQGGGYQLPNLIPECGGCNRSRGDKILRTENTR